jgi:uncharacterized protein YqhQ
LNTRAFLRLATHVQMLPILESGEETLVGGQAVMEGVMMRAPHSYCVAVRKPNGEIITEEQPLARMSEKYPIFKYPLLRGLGTLGQAMSLGVKALRFSANAALEDEAASSRKPAKGPQEISSWMMTLNLVFSLGFFIFLYKFVPLFLATQIGHYYPAVSGRIATNLVDGVIRIAIFLSFLFLVSRMRDIHRVFEYHGAEHKVVFNYESGKPVDVATAQTFTTFHPRCGTSFLLVVMVISMVVYSLVPVDGFAAKFMSRILLLPVIAGLSYELIRFAAKRQGGLMSVLTSPGLWLQRITTKQPDDQQLEIAIIALKEALMYDAIEPQRAAVA